ncbi:hypothetical protein GCM10011365_13240 [Marinicella pacifica]|uniref:Galactose oxidase-like protein n=1 Tax=Marinicella pacifica TaxID=1171543 RepID=A0A917CMN1_9GAMM|nr:hypothetical protein [Marinicella pacifica]GGF93349.1 hypothetical protein GCM10011365_13240 [Marinicella pacifica]
MEKTYKNMEMNRFKSVSILIISLLILFSNQSFSKDVVKPLPLAWTNLNQAEYIDNLVECKTAIDELKWSYNLWPEENKSPKPLFSEVVDTDKIRQSVLENLKMEAVLAKRFNFEITPEMLQHDLDRMARQTKDAKRLKELFDVLNNDPTTIAQCVSRPYLVQKKLANQFNFNNTIHAEVKQKAQRELDKYLLSNNTDDTTAQINTITYGLVSADKKSLDTEPSPEEINKKRIVELDAEEFKHIVKKSNNRNLQEHHASFVYTEIVEETQQSIKVKVLQWKKKSQNEWLSTHSDITYLPASKTHQYSLPKITKKEQGLNNKAAVIDRWENYEIEIKRRGSTAIWTGTEMIVWGGSNTYQDRGERYNPVSDSWSFMSTINAPLSRKDHSAVWTGSEMIIWGGVDREDNNQLNTGGRYNPDTDSWSSVNSNNTPSKRVGYTSVWTGTEMIIWGGYGDSGYLNTGGRYNPDSDSWSSISLGSNLPTERAGHTAVWTGSEMIIWGGNGDSGYLNTGGRYDPDSDSWSSISVGTNVPTGRYDHTAVWTGSKMIIWGGYGNDGALNTGGRYDPERDSWSSTTVATNVPNARNGHSAIWTGSEMIVWGGRGDSDYLNTGGRYDPSTDSWQATQVSGAPSGGYEHKALWTGSEMIVWDEYGNNLNASGRYDPVTDNWISMNTQDRSISRTSHTAIWTGNDMIVWGGINYGFLNSGFRYNLITHTWLSTNINNAPTGRTRHTAVWTGSDMIVWGGDDGGDFLNTGGYYNPGTDSWQATPTTGAPSGRYDHTAVWTGNEMIVWGGYGDSGYLNTGGRYDPDTDSWQATQVTGAPSGRSDHTAVWTGSEMIVWGGYFYSYSANFINTGGRYNPSTDSWQATEVTGAPAVRSHHTAVWTGSEMIIWGGTYFGNRLNTGGRYNPGTNSWQAIPTTGAPSVRMRHTAVWTGSKMIVWGGTGGGSLNTGGRYNPNTNSWQATRVSNAPSASQYHTAVWTGSEMIVWGTGEDSPIWLYYFDYYYDIRGSLSGLQGDQVTLQNNGGDDLILTSDGGFTFNTPILKGTGYDVTVLADPQNPSQTCTVTNGSGTNISADIEDVSIQCSDTFKVGVTVTGLAAGNTVKLNNNGSDLLEVSDNNVLTYFTTQMANGADYLITVDTQPSAPNQICSITPGEESGTINLADVHIGVSCTTLQYNIAVTVSGLDPDNSIELTTNGQSLVFNNNTTANFAQPLDDGTAYDVSLTEQPTSPNQVCTISGGNGGNDDGSGILAGEDVTILVNCQTVEYTLGGFVSGLATGNVLTLYNNTADEYLLISNNGSYAFFNNLPDGSGFDVSVASHPTSPNQTCSINNASGSIAGGDFTDVNLNCITKQYLVGGYAFGLIPNNHMVLQNNASDDLILRHEGAFVLPTPLDDLEGYDVTIQKQPDNPIQTCELANNSGTINGQDVESIFMYCDFGDDLIFRHGFDDVEAISRGLWELKDWLYFLN